MFRVSQKKWTTFLFVTGMFFRSYYKLKIIEILYMVMQV